MCTKVEAPLITGARSPPGSTTPAIGIAIRRQVSCRRMTRIAGARRRDHEHRDRDPQPGRDRRSVDVETGDHGDRERSDRTDTQRPGEGLYHEHDRERDQQTGGDLLDARLEVEGVGQTRLSGDERARRAQRPRGDDAAQQLVERHGAERHDHREVGLKDPGGVLSYQRADRPESDVGTRRVRGADVLVQHVRHHRVRRRRDPRQVMAVRQKPVDQDEVKGRVAVDEVSEDRAVARQHERRRADDEHAEAHGHLPGVGA